MKIFYCILVSIGILFSQDDERSTIFSTGPPPSLEEGWDLVYNESESFTGAIKFTSPGEYVFEGLYVAIYTDPLNNEFLLRATLYEDNNNTPGVVLGSWEFEDNNNNNAWDILFAGDSDCIVLEPGQSYWVSVQPAEITNNSAIWSHSEGSFTYALSENLGDTWEATSIGRVGCIEVKAEEIYQPSPDLSELGDINQDGNLDVLDVVSIVNFILGNSIPNDDEIFFSDLNQDGSLDVLDVVQLVNIILFGIDEDPVYMFSLEDINVNSDYFGTSVGPDTFISQNNVSCYYFGKAG